MDLIRFNELLKKYKEDQLSQQEWVELREEVLADNYDADIREDMLQLLQQMEAHVQWTPHAEQEVWDQIVEKRQPVQRPEDVEHKIRPFKYLKWVAAAAVLITIMAGTFYYYNRSAQQPVIAVVKDKKMNIDIAPPANTHAYITLANGQQIILDNTGTGTLAKQGDVNVVKMPDGQIAYSGKNGEVMFNRLSNPRGSRVINLVLSDGTRIWLNSESSLYYPTVFTGAERNVEITGEAYFEVAKDPHRKFIVSCRGMKTEVLGTHFNFNAYEDEATAKVTLLEGKVKVSNGAGTGILLPGQQARMAKDIKIVSDIDTEEVIAWKNGKFQFGEATDIAAVMREIARWYNVEVEYRGNVTGHIGGTISRDVNASEVFKMLEMTGSIKFQIEGKKIIVMP